MGELWSKSGKFLLISYVMRLIHINTAFFTISQPKDIRFWKRLHVLHILGQSATFLFHKFFTLFSEKNTYLLISRKDPHEIFYKYIFSFMHIMGYHAMGVPTLVIFFSVNCICNKGCTAIRKGVQWKKMYPNNDTYPKKLHAYRIQNIQKIKFFNEPFWSNGHRRSFCTK